MRAPITTVLRERCADIAAGAQHVQIEHERLRQYAAGLPLTPGGHSPVGPDADQPVYRRTAAFWLTLNAINFGSGWFPTLRKRQQPTGYRTVAAGVSARFERQGPWTADELGSIGAGDLGALMDQDPEHELMTLFAWSLRDLGGHLLAEHGGSYDAVVAHARGSAVRLVETLAGWDCFADTSTYAGRSVPFLKRAQITAADLQRAGAAGFGDLDRLTMFADNLVPHVLRLDGVLRFDPHLVARIEREELIEHGSAEEVEIRACAVHAVELLVAAAPGPLTAAAVDEYLWNRGQGSAYKARPRHRSRSTAY